MTSTPRSPHAHVGHDDPSRVAVDILINNYNYGRFLAAAIDSALAQTHPNVNVIVVDDGSTDASLEIIRAYDGIAEIVLKANGGQASAFNSGFARSAGDVVMFLDADDMLKPTAAALVATAFARDAAVTKVQYRMEVVDEHGRRTGVVKPARHLHLPQGDVRRAELTFPFDLVWLATSANAFSADALRRLMPVPEWEFAECPDWYLVHLTPLLGRVVSLYDVAAYYRVHGRNRYEPHSPTLDLAHIRRTIGFAGTTSRALEMLADELDLERPRNGPLSVSDLANRLVSLKLAPDLHPIPADRAWRLVLEGARAASRRFDISWPLKLLCGCWFAAIAVAPRGAAQPIAELFLFPERRMRVNRFLGRFHRSDRSRHGVRG
jgi:Glycosyl transferase family 2